MKTAAKKVSPEKQNVAAKVLLFLSSEHRQESCKEKEC